jgi:hypothetical protein
MDDKILSEMILHNITAASAMNIKMDEILNVQQMRLLETYKETYNYDPSLSFFLSLGMMSHFSQGSYYTHYASSDHRLVQLYMWLLGSSGKFSQYLTRESLVNVRIQHSIKEITENLSFTFIVIFS